MVKNQLFKAVPPLEICEQVLEAFGLSSFDDVHLFSRDDIVANDCIDKLNELKPVLMRFYFPCKARTYLNDLNPKNALTVLRQIIRFHNYGVVSREKYIRGKKTIVYQLIPIEKKDIETTTEFKCTTGEKPCTITFK